MDLCRTVSDGVSGVSSISYQMLGERYGINTKILVHFRWTLTSGTFLQKEVVDI